MNFWKTRYGQWEGTVSDLADLAEMLERTMFPNPVDGSSAPNVRLIRHYVTEGVLSRAERRGKEAFFGFRQLLELLGARVLIREGWPLAKVAEVVRSASEDKLTNLLPPLALTSAERLVASFRGRDSASRSPSVPPSIEAAAVSTAGLRTDLVALGNTGGALGISRHVQIEIAPWCRVLVEANALRLLDDDAMDRLARAFRKALGKAKFMKGEDR